MKTNPKVKKGDLIIVKMSANGLPTHLLDTPLLVNSTGSRSDNFIVKAPNGGSYNIYNTAPADEYIFASSEAQKEYLREEIKRLQNELDFLEKYPTQEDYVAHKLCVIMDAYDQAKTPEAKAKAMSDVLKELKASDML